MRNKQTDGVLTARFYIGPHRTRSTHCRNQHKPTCPTNVLDMNRSYFPNKIYFFRDDRLVKWNENGILENDICCNNYTVGPVTQHSRLLPVWKVQLQSNSTFVLTFLALVKYSEFYSSQCYKLMTLWVPFHLIQPYRIVKSCQRSKLVPVMLATNDDYISWKAGIDAAINLQWNIMPITINDWYSRSLGLFTQQNL